MRALVRLCMFSFCLLLALPLVARAEDTLLTVTGSDGTVTTYDRPALEALPVSEFETSTVWTDGKQTFRGVRMTDLLQTLGVKDGTLQLTAENDYSITIPVDSFTEDGAIIAYERNGAAMTLRSKGPLWLVYPYDSSPNFQTEVVYANSIWQLDRIKVIK